MRGRALHEAMARLDEAQLRVLLEHLLHHLSCAADVFGGRWSIERCRAEAKACPCAYCTDTRARLEAAAPRPALPAGDE